MMRQDRLTENVVLDGNEYSIATRHTLNPVEDIARTVTPRFMIGRRNPNIQPSWITGSSCSLQLAECNLGS